MNTLRAGCAALAVIGGLAGAAHAVSEPAVALATPQLWVVDELTGFQSPSFNVGCYIDPEMVRCDIAERDWAPPPRPADCYSEMESGQGLLINAGGESGVVCAGDTALGYGEVLPYGGTIQSGELQCDSTEAAMTCRDNSTGHGFSLSRQGYQLF